ncbi:DUF397 domain-containing protein [Micromonospora aurantiaca]
MELTGAIWPGWSGAGQQDPAGPVLTFTPDAWQAFVRLSGSRASR